MIVQREPRRMSALCSLVALDDKAAAFALVDDMPRAVLRQVAVDVARELVKMLTAEAAELRGLPEVRSRAAVARYYQRRAARSESLDLLIEAALSYCAGTTKDGRECRMRVSPYDDYCRHHRHQEAAL